MWRFPSLENEPAPRSAPGEPVLQSAPGESAPQPVIPSEPIPQPVIPSRRRGISAKRLDPEGRFAEIAHRSQDGSRGPRGVFPTIAFIALLMFSCAAPPHLAWAYFNEVDDKNSAQQDIGAYGAPLAAADIPEGTYVVDVRTTSRMCVFYNTATDAATRSDNKGLATITVSGGAIVASFYMSPAYTHLYLGTGAQAAKLTDKTGTDDSAYVKGVPYAISASGGTSNAYHYTMPLPSLNSEVAFASFDGGSAGVEEGKWFDRRVVFMPGDEVTAAIEAAKSPEGKSSKKREEKPVEEDGPADDVQDAAEREPQVVYVYVDEPEPAAGATAARTAQAHGEGEAASREGPTGERRGVMISPVQVSVQSAAAADAPEAAVARSEERGPSEAQVIAAALAGAALLGCLARIVLFAAGKAGRM